MKYTYYFNVFDDAYALQRDLDGEDINAGDKVLVYSCENNLRGGEEWRLSKRFAGTGYPGNTDPSIRRFHGWRGTTNDVAIYAYGVYSVKSVTYSGDIMKVIINRTDLKRNED